ncbi:RpiB/LacA/LacB family sugar-phosphate isomerase [Tunturiibacter gelidiferens]|uniref:RpiB/LacA/LacB family sugar-phosphate isomerase n=1 Tax=Tunturiibacter gelidiferens TaxID=3069689 RepID=UPI003D9BF17D
MRVGVADHGGFEMKEQLAKLLAEGGHQVVDFGNKIYDNDDDYPDFAIPLATCGGKWRSRTWHFCMRERRGSLGSCE